MLTPSNVTASQFNSAVKSDTPTHVRLTFTGQNITLTDSDIDYNGGLTINTILNTDTDLTIGSAAKAEVIAYILNSSNVANLNWEGEFKLEVGAEVNGSTQWITIGYFTGSCPDKIHNVDVIYFVAYDRMSKFDKFADEWLKSLTYPITVSQMYSSLCSYVGISKESGNELSNIMNRSFSSPPILNMGLTCRDILSLIAEAAGCYARVNASGKVKLVWYSTANYSLTADDEFSVDAVDLPFPKTWAELESYKWSQLESTRWSDLGGYAEALRVNAVCVKQTEDDTGISVPNVKDGNIYYIVDNPFLAIKSDSDVQNYIRPIYIRLNSFFGYLPMSVQCIGNPLIEVGDVITAAVGEHTVKMPIFVKTTLFNGALTDGYEATGNQKRQNYSQKVKEKLSQGGKYHIFKNDIDGLKSEVADAEQNITLIEQNVSGIETRVSNAEGDITSIVQNVDGITQTVAKKNRTYYANSAPTGTTADPLVTGDLWVDTEHNNKLKRYDGSSWVDSSYNDPDIPAISLQVSKKARTYSSNSAPTGTTSDPLVTGDLWVDTAHNNKMKRYNGSSWVDVSDTSKYTIVSGIDIAAEGIQITGSRYVKIISGGTFLVDSTDFKIDSTNKLLKTGEWKIYDKGLCSLYNADTAQNPHMVEFRLFTPNIDGTDTIYDYTNCYASIVAGGSYGQKAGSLAFFIRYGNNSDIDAYEMAYNATRQKFEFSVPSAKPVRFASTDTPISEAYITDIYGTLHSASSREKKHNIKEIEDVGEAIDKCTPVSFVYNDDEEEKEHYGLIYEDTVNLLPVVCEDTDGLKNINYVEIVPILLKEIQNLRKRVSSLENGTN